MVQKGRVRVNDRVKTLAEAVRLSVTSVSHATIEVDKVFRRRELEIFASEGAARGTPWPELSDNPPGRGYASWKKKNYPGKKILQLTGKLREAFVQKESPQHEASYYNGPRGWIMRFGAFGPWHWQYHYEGGSIVGRPPVRNMLASDAESIRQMRSEAITVLRPYVKRVVTAYLSGGVLRNVK